MFFIFLKDISIIYRVCLIFEVKLHIKKIDKNKLTIKEVQTNEREIIFDQEKYLLDRERKERKLRNYQREN